MNHLIMADLEGAAGVERFGQTLHDQPFKVPAMRLLTEEVNACIAGIFDADPAARVLVIDRHCSGILPGRLDPRARCALWGEARKLIRPAYRGFDTYLYVGQHAMAGLPNAPLAHTDASKHIVYKRFNGVFVGEFGIEAIRAGAHGVPVIFFAGDDKAAAEARALVPEIVTVVTKWGEGWQKARHLDPRIARVRIRAGAAAGVRRAREVKPLRVDPPYTHEIRFVHPRDFTKVRIEGVNITQIDARTVLFRFDDIDKLQVTDF